MIKVGLTGNYYSDYELISKNFANRGIPIFDADIVLKFILHYSQEVISKIKIKYGNNIFNMGLIDLTKFNSTDKFNGLLDIIQLDLMTSYEKWRLKNLNAKYTIFKSSFLFERNINESMNYTISVFKPKNDRVSIALSNTEIPISEIYDIVDSEIDELVKNQKSNYIIHNYIDTLDIQISSIHSNLIKK